MQPTQELYGYIVDAYNYFNEILFYYQPLPECIITLQRQKKTMGYVSYNRWIETGKEGRLIDELALNPEYWMNWPITEVLSTLVHEQCHIWQGAYGTPGRGRYHNQEWADKMLSIGLVPSSTGKPGGRKTGDKMNDYIALDGFFHQTLQKLIEPGYKFPWIDSMPQGNPSMVNIYNNVGQEYTLRGKPAENASPEERHCQRPDNPDLVSQSSEDNSEQKPEAKLPKKKQSNREKYSCQSCKANIWGKPNLHVICGKCKKDFKLEDQKKAS